MNTMHVHYERSKPERASCAAANEWFGTTYSMCIQQIRWLLDECNIDSSKGTIIFYYYYNSSSLAKSAILESLRVLAL